MLLRVIKIYLVLSTVVLFAWVGLGAYIALERNVQSSYCDYAIDEGEANYVAHGVPCRIRLDEMAKLGAFLLLTLAVFQGPVYLYFLVRYICRARSKPKP